MGTGHLLLSPLAVQATADALAEVGGGYKVLHTSPGLELGVYVLRAPEPDGQVSHQEDELYLLIEGTGVLVVEGERNELHQGEGVFVPAGARHHFEDYTLLKLLVVFRR